ncbi:FtsK/SpoIIIE domain-containing protein [Pseudonocardia petroleophila]|uniref:FtsK domain-containing protein n=1 Tax=Pseudonocardia petroleophila TaxID=37331 RepID=A0A7G7MFX0_9PSEU|nr:hypothetical protein [Pseudonocardia petroleophila]QNG51681.1 hypothetical protein H6H00_26835 [Pseudonocardia petroleophila]
MTLMIKPPDKAVLLARKVAPVAVYPVSASGRGTARVLRGYRDWMLCKKREDSAARADVYYKEADAIRAHQHARIKGTLIGLVVLVAGLVLIWVLTPPWVQFSVVLAIWSMLVLAGRQAPGKVAPRSHGDLLWAGIEQLNAAFLASGLIKKDQTVTMVERPHADGKGSTVTIDLPPGITAAAAIASKERLASALALDENGLVLARVRSDGGHAGRLSIWATKGDPFAAGSGHHPLLGEQSWNAWRGAPFGLDARGREIKLRLVGSNMLIGAAPNAGKTFAGRSAAAPFVLDPGAVLLIANGKGDDAWAAAEQTAAAYVRGYDDNAAARVNAMLDRVIAEMDARNARRTGSKLTEGRSRDADDPMPLMLVLIDELQNFTGNTTPDPGSDERKPPTLGQLISRKLTHLAKNARSSGIILLLLTQRPDDDSLPKGLRAVLMTRFALRTRDRWNSDMILGPDFSARGYSTAQDDWLKGVGILVPDDDDNESAVASYPTLRTFEVPDEEWEALCRRGAALRRDQGHGDGWNPGGGGEGPVNPIEPAQPDVEADELPENLIALREYLLRPGNEFRASFELQRELGINSRELTQLMSSLGLSADRDYILDAVAGTKRRVWGYRVSQALAAIEDAEADAA